MADTPYPLPQSSRQTPAMLGSGESVYGPFGDGWGIFDVDDVVVHTRPVSPVNSPWVETFVEVAKVLPAQALSAFTITFSAPLLSTHEFRATGKRWHRRELAVTRGHSMDGQALELELSKQSVVLQEQARDIDGVDGRIDGVDLRIDDVEATLEAAGTPVPGAALAFVRRDGSTAMTGPLVLAGDATLPLHAPTSQQVDTLSRRRVIDNYAAAIAYAPPATIEEIETREYRAGTLRGGAIYRRTTGSIFELTTADGAKWQMMLPLHVDKFGCYGDGALDDLPFWNSAKTAAVQRGGGVIHCGDRLYALSDTVVLNNSNIMFEGAGPFGSLFSFPAFGTRVKRIGALASVMFLYEPPAGPTTILNGGGFRNIAVDCNAVSSIGFYIGSVVNYECSGCYVYLPNNAAYFTTATYADGVVFSNYNEAGNFSKSVGICIGDAIPFYFSGKADGLGHSSAFHNLDDLYAVHENGTAILFDAADDCHGKNFGASRISHQFTAVRTSGSTVLTSVSSTVGVKVGNVFNNQPGIPNLVTVVGVTTDTITMSAAATSTAAVTSYTVDGAGLTAFFSGSGISHKGLATGNTLQGHGQGGVVFGAALDGTASGFPATGNRFFATSVDNIMALTFQTGTRATNEYYDSGCAYTNAPAYGHGPPLLGQQFGLNTSDKASFKGVFTPAIMSKATLLASIGAATAGFGAVAGVTDGGANGFLVYSNGVNWLYVRNDVTVT